MNPFAHISLPDMSMPSVGPAMFLFWMVVVIMYAIRTGMKEDRDVAIKG